MRFPDVIFSGVERRREAIEEARAAGKQGATRVPDTVLFAHGDPSDSMIVELVQGWAEGAAEREVVE